MTIDSNETGLNGLSVKQERAIAALLSEPSVKRAASAAGVGESTLFRWLSDDSFRAAYLDARRKVLSAATARMQQFTSEAATILQSIMADKKQPAYARVAAARTIIQNAFTGLELEDHSKRLADIENRLKESVDAPNY
jgi:hypothetical protein